MKRAFSPRVSRSPGGGQAPELGADDRRAIRRCLDSVKAHVAARGAGRDALEDVKERLLALAARRDSFHYERFPVRGRGRRSVVYLLDEEEDRSFALYAVAGVEGNMSPPHDHTVWAVIAGIEGEETNRFYERLDDGREAGRAEIRESGQATVKAGTAIALAPDDIHSIHCLRPEPTLSFHLYGRSIAHLPERRMFDMSDGTCRVFPAHPSIIDLTKA